MATSRSRAASTVVIGYDDRSGGGGGGGGLESVRYCCIALRPTDLAFGRRASGRRNGEGRVFVGRVIVGQTSIVFFARLAVFRLLSRSLCERMYFTETCVTYCLLLSMFFTHPCSVNCIFSLRLCTVVGSDVEEKSPRFSAPCQVMSTYI